MQRHLAVVVIVFAAVVAWRAAPGAQQRVVDGPKYTSGGELLRPTDYREWVYVTTGLGMTYGSAQAAAGRPANFDNVFVNRDAYRRFMATGTWPEGTMFILEIRGAKDHASIDNAGRTQGNVIALEASVKDSARFPETTWAYFDLGLGNNLAPSARPLPTSAACYSCHKNNTAVEWTFVQFYPTLLEVAERLGTVKPAYDPLRKP